MPAYPLMSVIGGNAVVGRAAFEMGTGRPRISERDASARGMQL
jgi:hypothetical protein